MPEGSNDEPPSSSQPFWQNEPLFTKHVAAVTMATMSALPHLPFETAIANAFTTVRNVGPPPPLKLDKKPGGRRSGAPSPPTPIPTTSVPQGNFTFADMVKAATSKPAEERKKPTWRAIETSKALVLRPSTKGTRVSELHLRVPKTTESAPLFQLKGTALLERIAKLVSDHAEPAPRMALCENPLVFIKWSMRGNLVFKCAKPMDDLIKEGIKDAILYFLPTPSAEVMILNKPPTTALKFLAVPCHNLDGSDTDDMDLLNDLTAHPAWASVELWSNPKFVNLKPEIEAKFPRKNRKDTGAAANNGKGNTGRKKVGFSGPDADGFVQVGIAPGIARIDAIASKSVSPEPPNSLKPDSGSIVGALADEALRPELQGNEEARRLMQETILDEAAFAAADAAATSEDNAPPRSSAASDIDFLFIQENPVSFVRNVPTSKNEIGDPLIGPVAHKQWQCIEKTALQPSLQVAIYVNNHFLDNFQIFPNFSPTIDPNVLIATMKHNTIRSCSFNIINVYNPPKTRNSAVRSLIDILPQLSNTMIIQGDFNLPSGIWDPGRNSSSPLSVDLFNHLSDKGFGLANDEGAPTWTNRRGSFSVLDLVFISDSLAPLNPDVFVNMEGHGRSDHALLSLAFGTTEHWGRPYIPSGEEEEDRFIQDLSDSIRKSTQTLHHRTVEDVIEGIGQDILGSWNRNSKTPRVSAGSITWWTAECQRAKDEFLAARTRENQKVYNAATKKARQEFFNRKIDLMTANDSPWEGVRWTKPRPPPKYSMILRDGCPIDSMEALFDTMHSHFSTSPAADHISWEAINSIPQRATRSFPPISQKEIWDALRPMANSSAPGPDHLTWRHVKLALTIPETDVALMTLYNKVCFTGTWPTHFKESTSVIIPKPNKPDYMIPKAYRPIALLNTLGKLLTKILANRLQHDVAEHGILHRDQFGGIQGHSTIDAGLVLTDFISEHREHGWHTSVCAVDVAQFFPSLSHKVMGQILKRLGFSQVIVTLIQSYFRDRATVYKWDSTLSKKYDFALGTPQGDCLSPILSALYISVAIRKVFPETMPPATTRCLFYVDDGVIVTASPSLQMNVAILRVYLLLLLQALSDIGLQVEASKTELMHFFAFELTAARRLAISHQPSLDFTWRGVHHEISPSARWQYLGFFFTPTLDFSFHVQFYTNKVFSTIRACSMLGNSVRGIGPRQCAHAYQACVLSVLTYGLPLWYTMWGSGVIRLVKRMERVHSYALGWVIGAFRTSPQDLFHSEINIPFIAPGLYDGFRKPLVAPLLVEEPATSQPTIPSRGCRLQPCGNSSSPIIQSHTRVSAYQIYFPIGFSSTSPPQKERPNSSMDGDGRSLVYSDGAYWTKTSCTSYAFTAFHDGAWHDTLGWCPAGSSYDAELAALEEAIQWAIVRCIPDPIFLIDNKSVLLSFLDLSTHSSQTSSIRINMLLKDFLSSTDSTLSFAYCPSHVGIEGNERADRLTKEGAALGPATPIQILRSNFLNRFKWDMSRHWRILAQSQTYKGQSWIPIRRKRRLFKPDVGNKQAKHFFLTLSGNDIETTSHMAHALTNHAPTGEYRRRFHPNAPTYCKHCRPSVEHTRQHIFFSCPAYAPLATSFTDWKRNRHNDKSWKIFFQANPSAYTFGDLPEDVH
ncbi:hypothetical protein AX14_013649 [Amanita brunnescens Koide BX004]|nr:hypothetical protein AX14_013649 [Amanita brunnescens Koide BX004]